MKDVANKEAIIVGFQKRGKSLLKYNYFVNKVKHLTPNWKLLGFGPLKILVTRPSTGGYGPFCIDILLSLHVGKGENAFVYFIESKRNASRYGGVEENYWVNPVLFRIESPDVFVVNNRRWLDFILSTLLFLLEIGQKFYSKINQRFRRIFFSEKKCEEVSKGLYRGPYFRKSLTRNPITVNLRDQYLEQAIVAAQDFGICTDKPLVTLHCRESGVDYAKKSPVSHVESALRRNAEINTFFPAMDFLVDQGYTVVRIGDPTMTPVDRHGVVDLALRPNRLVEFYSLIKSNFFLGVGSGPWMAAYLTNTPILMVNSTHPIVEYPVRLDCMYILKHVVDIAKDAKLSLQEILSEDFLFNQRDIGRYRYIDNSGEEILTSTIEMVEFLKSPPPLTKVQSRYGDLARQAAKKIAERYHVTDSHIRQEVRDVLIYGVDNGFIGEGRIAHWFSKRYML